MFFTAFQLQVSRPVITQVRTMPPASCSAPTVPRNGSITSNQNQRRSQSRIPFFAWSHLLSGYFRKEIDCGPLPCQTHAQRSPKPPTLKRAKNQNNFGKLCCQNLGHEIFPELLVLRRTEAALRPWAAVHVSGAKFGAPASTKLWTDVVQLIQVACKLEFLRALECYISFALR
jgi:hypothetical protein